MIRHTLEGYVNDMLVKSKKDTDYLEDLDNFFARMVSQRGKLYLLENFNPSNCAFRINSGKFMGFMVSQRGFKVNSGRVIAREEMKSPTCHKDTQHLNGRLTTLARFLYKYGENVLPFV